MNNEPVAWAIKADNDFTEIGFDDELLEEIEQMYVMEGWKYEVIPLYTHPVKELKNIVVASATCSCGKVMEVTNLQPVKELTDEEIIDLINRHIDYVPDEDSGMKLVGVMDFAKAILRKAQEK